MSLLFSETSKIGLGCFEFYAIRGGLKPSFAKDI